MLVLLIVFILIMTVGLRMLMPLLSFVVDTQSKIAFKSELKQKAQYAKAAEKYISTFKEQLEDEEKYISCAKLIENFDPANNPTNSDKENRMSRTFMNFQKNQLKTGKYKMSKLTAEKQRKIDEEARWMAENYVRGLPLRSQQVKHIVPLHIKVDGDYKYRETRKKYFPNKR